MVWDVIKNGRIVQSFRRSEIDIAYRLAVQVKGFVTPRQVRK